MEGTVPARLYKYQPYNPQTLDNLTKRKLWFSKPEAFNDPFDGSVGYDLEEISDEQWKSLGKYFAAKWPGGAEEFARVHLTDGRPNEAFRVAALEGAATVARDVYKLDKDRGVACFTEKVDDLLMWAHYADGHRGFCLEFDTALGPFEKVQPVTYCDHYPKIDVVAAALGTKAMSLPILTTKSMDWSREKEWRVLHEVGNIEYGIDLATLTGLYFGCAMPYVHLEIIALILRHSPTRLYRMRRSETDFSVTPELVEYKPYDYSKPNA